MMYPRLYLARNLLRDDGVIFISIDDNEVSNLRKVCDEIFGEENFVANVIWQKKYSPANDAKWLSDNHDHILLYAKNKEYWRPILLPRSEEANSRYFNPDNDKRGDWKPGDMTVKTYSEKYDYPITTPSGREVYPAQGRCWVVPREKYQELVADNRVWFGADGNNIPAIKRFLTEVKQGITPMTIWLYEEVGHNQEGRQELKEIFDDKGFFDGPKPVRLLKRILQISTSAPSASPRETVSDDLRKSAQSADEPDIILDFFSGSATSAHAVLDLNKRAGGSRKFIMVQLPEPCAEDSEAFKAGYKNIADIGKERIRRVIKKLNEENESKLDLSGGATEDRGFKVLKLDKSNFKQWRKLAPEAKPEEIEKQLFDHIDHIAHKATPEDLLFEILIKTGFMSTKKVQTITLAGVPVYSIADGERLVLICLADTVTKELINAVAEAEPNQFICLDKAFGGNDQLKANAVQTFAARNMGRDKVNQIVFRTV